MHGRAGLCVFRLTSIRYNLYLSIAHCRQEQLAYFEHDVICRPAMNGSKVKHFGCEIFFRERPVESHKFLTNLFVTKSALDRKLFFVSMFRAIPTPPLFTKFTCNS